MSIWGAIAGGFVGTIVLTSGLRAASELRLTRMDLPFLLGTAFSSDRVRAKAAGYLLHFAFGLGFAVIYYAIFQAIDKANWWLGALFGPPTPSSPAPPWSTSSCRLSTHGWERQQPPPTPAPSSSPRVPAPQLRNLHSHRDARHAHRLRRHRRRVHRALELAAPGLDDLSPPSPW